MECGSVGKRLFCPRTLLAGALLLGVTGLVEAACTTQSYRFNLHENQTVNTFQTVDQSGCETGFGAGAAGNVGGSLETRYESITVLKRAQNLVIEPTSNGFGYAIKVRGGYRGKDSYAMRACGTTRLGKGCVTVNFDVTVQ
jgi:hypothetical protein